MCSVFVSVFSQLKLSADPGQGSTSALPIFFSWYLTVSINTIDAKAKKGEGFSTLVMLCWFFSTALFDDKCCLSGSSCVTTTRVCYHRYKWCCLDVSVCVYLWVKILPWGPLDKSQLYTSNIQAGSHTWIILKLVNKLNWLNYWPWLNKANNSNQLGWLWVHSLPKIHFSITHAHHGTWDPLLSRGAMDTYYGCQISTFNLLDRSTRGRANGIMCHWWSSLMMSQTYFTYITFSYLSNYWTICVIILKFVLIQ